MPEHEKEYEARLMIDEAIKEKTEYHLEAIARMLSGKNKIRWHYAKEEPIEHVESFEDVNGNWFQVKHKHAIEARMREFVFYGNSRTEIFLKIIDFWAGKKTIFPCGGSSISNP